MTQLGQDSTGDFNTSNFSVDQALAWGNAQCEDLNDGDSVAFTLNDGAAAAEEANSDYGTSFTTGDAYFLIGDATATLCPQYGAEVQAYAQANGG
jgi:hypothetical protein